MSSADSLFCAMMEQLYAVRFVDCTPQPEGVRIVNGQVVERLRFIPVSSSPNSLEPSAGIVPGASRGGG